MGARERGSSESSTRSERSTDTMSQGDDTTSHKSDPSPMVSYVQSIFLVSLPTLKTPKDVLKT